MPPFHWSKIPQKNSPLPLPFTLHLKTPTLLLFSDNTLAADLTVKDVMDTWTLQTGFPLLTVTRDYNTQTATVAQVPL